VYARSVLVGTGFMAAPGILMTNRHVAQTFAKSNGDFKSNTDTGEIAAVAVDFAVTVANPNLRLQRQVSRVLYIAPADAPDVALLQLSDDEPLPPPLPLQLALPSNPRAVRSVLVCGYPTGGKNPVLERAQLRVRGVKRISLGECQLFDDDSANSILAHDCSTANGSSGSPLVDFDSGKVLGLHFRGDLITGVSNGAVPLWEIARIDGAATYLPAPEGPVNPTVELEQLPVPTRPAWQCANGEIVLDSEERANWFEPGSATEGALSSSLQSIGLLKAKNHPLASSESMLVNLQTCFVISVKSALTLDVPGDALPETNPANGRPVEYFVEFTEGDFKFPELGEKGIVAAEDSPVGRRVLVRAQIVSSDIAPPEDEFDSSIRTVHILFPEIDDLPPPLEYPDAPGDDEDLVNNKIAVIGYPLNDSQAAPPDVFRAVFGTSLGTQRACPGLVMSVEETATGNIVHHDCSTCVGMVGAPIFEIASGKIVGVHLGGKYLIENNAVTFAEAFSGDIEAVVELLREIAHDLGVELDLEEEDNAGH
jgi:endonuclease G